jgi:hypothetical protein
MFRILKTRADDANIDAGAVSSAQSAPIPAPQAERRLGDDTLLESLASLSRASGMTVVQHGARLAVIGELLVSVLTQMPAAMRTDTVEAFRNRIEDLMSMSDDRRLPEQYHSALLTEVNRYLNALR